MADDRHNAKTKKTTTFIHHCKTNAFIGHIMYAPKLIRKVTFLNNSTTYIHNNIWKCVLLRRRWCNGRFEHRKLSPR